MKPAKPRFDGWTPKRQLAFLDVLARTRSVSAAARAAGMRREGAYRLRRRDAGGLFAALWDRAMGAHCIGLTRSEIDEGHRRAVAAGHRTEGAAPRNCARHHQLRDLSAGPIVSVPGNPVAARTFSRS